MLVDATERKEAESRQQMLLQELNHRVKNNLQMLHSLLNSANRETADSAAKTVLSDAAQRVAAIAAAQKVLYNAHSQAFDAAEFLKSVCDTASQSFEKDVTIEIAPVAGKLANEVSMPLALILNELLTNEVKHGINGTGKGTVYVELREKDDELHLSVKDKGAGFG